ncbi:uncharacterized protein LOC132704623 [Cylas formicarius]|uniref:uncharacterized protein LOC132704623 n=1 Tax=Cylas formicarius TaxID=197179 RepID=UPI0029589822|nr:uncharacterized protein LOC132704623 [Cylas formicarius]
MNTLLLIAVILSLICLSSGFPLGNTALVGPGEPGTLLKGPRSKATVKGADGTFIIGGGDTGAVASGPKAGGVVGAAEESAGLIALESPAPVLVHESPIVSDNYHGYGQSYNF